MNWRERRWLLVILVVLLVGNLAFFFTYRVRYQQRVEALDRASEAATADLEAAKERRARAEQTLAGYRKIDQDIQSVYDEHWSTPERRLTQLLLELRSMENRSRLVPQATSFVLTESRKEFGTREMGIQFSVRGTYSQIRQLINLIELSPHFVVIDSISLAEAGEEGTQLLSMNLQLRTLFRPDPDAPMDTRRPL
jgi:Tfp pilus assembly protein PilO